MEQMESFDKKKVVAYAFIAVGMIGFIIVGVMWAKNRAGQLAQSGQESPTQQETPQPAPQEQPATPDPGHIASTQTTTPSSGHIVPAAGASDTLLLVGAVSATSFMGVRYLQTRRYMRTAYR